MRKNIESVEETMPNPTGSKSRPKLIKDEPDLKEGATIKDESDNTTPKQTNQLMLNSDV